MTTPKLTTHGVYNTVQRTVYTTVVTIIATIITGVIAGRLRVLYLRKVDKKLPELNRDSDETKKQVNSFWKTILQIGECKDMFHNCGAEFVFLLAAVITTAITAGFTPTTSSIVVPYNFNLTSGDPTVMARAWEKNSVPQGCGLYWTLPNGSYYCAWVWNGASPQHKTWKLMQGINIENPDVFAYDDLGVAIKSSAIAAPVTLYDAQLDGYGLKRLMNEYNWDVNAVSACVPVMIHNPVKCRPGGTISFTNDGGATNMWLKSNDGSCVVDKTGLRSLSQNPVYMLKNLCMGAEIGQTTVIIGAANSNYAQWVAAAVGVNLSSSFTDSNGNQIYSVECTIDTRNNNVFEFRNVTLSLNPHATDKSITNDIPFNRLLSGSNNPCTSTNPSAIGDPIFATASTGSYFALYEDGAAGWSQSLIEAISSTGDYGSPAASSIRIPPFAFSESQNALEDVIALMGAFSVSRLILTSSLKESSGSAEIFFTRIGPGKTFAIVYAIIPLLVASLMIWLLLATINASEEYSAAELLDLVRLGRDTSSVNS